MKSKLLILFLLLVALFAVAPLTLKRDAPEPPPIFLGPAALRPNASAVAPESVSPSPADRALSLEGSDLAWFNALDLRVEGQGWTDTAGPYDRLPSRAEASVPSPVWDLSKFSSGLTVRFVTDSPLIAANWDGGKGTGFLSVRAAAGLDLYAFRDGAWEFCASEFPQAVRTTENLATTLKEELTEYMIFLPLRNRITDLKIGVRPGSVIAPPSSRSRDSLRPIVIYGTSIVQGLSASRPGVTHLAQIARSLDREIINLGFIGAGKMEPALAELLVELDPAFYVIDCVPNLHDQDVENRHLFFVRRIRETRPTTPILIVGTGQFGRAIANLTLQRAYETLVQEGVENLFYLPGEGMLDYDLDTTIDGAHPNDFGFHKMAGKYEQAFREVIQSLDENN